MSKKRRYSKEDVLKFLLYDATSKQFYRSRAWARLKARVYETYPRVCMCCWDSESQMHVDHIRPRSIEPKLSLTLSNLQVLCYSCNIQKSNIHAEDYREQAATRELDRDMYLSALAVGL